MRNTEKSSIKGDASEDLFDSRVRLELDLTTGSGNGANKAGGDNQLARNSLNGAFSDVQFTSCEQTKNISSEKIGSRNNAASFRFKRS